MNKTKLYLLGLALLLSSPSFAEDVKITAYYPSPYGNYKKLQVTDTLEVGLGTALLPSFFFGDTNTGMWSSGADTLNFSTNGAERVRIDSSGNVEVGLGAVATPSFSFLGDTNTGMWSSTADTINFSTAGIERVRIDNAGNVGIGTNAPNAKAQLEINSTTKGFLPPRMTGSGVGNQRDAMGAPNTLPAGLMIYNTSSNQLEVNNGTAWVGVGGGGGGGTQMLHVRDQKASGTTGGTAVVNTWTARTLNTIVTNTIIPAPTLSSNTITNLPAGTYRIWAKAPVRDNARHKIRLRNITDSPNTTTVVGSSARSDVSSNTSSISGAQFTIADTKSFQLQYYCDNPTSTEGLGEATTSGEVEVYAEVVIQKVA